MEDCLDFTNIWVGSAMSFVFLLLKPWQGWKNKQWCLMKNHRIDSQTDALLVEVELYEDKSSQRSENVPEVHKRYFWYQKQRWPAASSAGSQSLAHHKWFCKDCYSSHLASSLPTRTISEEPWAISLLNQHVFFCSIWVMWRWAQHREQKGRWKCQRFLFVFSCELIKK